MKKLINSTYTGERALYNSNKLNIDNCIFEDGESPLKESSNIDIINSEFRWKYPLWYCKNITVTNTKWLETARSGVWYTKNLVIKDSIIDAPKQFRRASKVKIFNTKINNAQETFWNCNNVYLRDVYANGDYFGMNSKNFTVENFTLDGNYFVDGGKNIVVRNAILNSKDAFWNCENVEVYDSKIIGEYLGWNSKNIKFVNCDIESNQGLCYIKNIVLENCRLVNTDLSFEYCESINANVTTVIDSVKNPISGYIHAKGIKEIIIDENCITPEKTIIEVDE